MKMNYLKLYNILLVVLFSYNAAISQCASPTNISQGKTASQSSNFPYNTYPASFAVDGILNNSNNFNHTDNELQPWWQVDLGSDYSVTEIKIYNRTGCSGCNGRIKNFKVFVSQNEVGGYTETQSVVYSYSNTTGLIDGQIIDIPNLNVTGRYVRIWVDNTTQTTNPKTNPIHLAEVEVFGCTTAVGSPPTAPTSISTANATASQITVSWTGATGATNYVLERASPLSVSSYIAVSSNANSPFTDNGLTASTAYWYRVKAVNAAGSSAYITTTSSTTTLAAQTGGTCTSPTNISQGKTASQSSNYDQANSYPATNVIDGNNSNFNHTNLELNPWIEINLGSIHTVSSIQIINRNPGYGRLNTFKVFVSNNSITDYNNNSQVFLNASIVGDGATVAINASNASLPISGQYVKVFASNPTAEYLNLSEIIVNGCIDGGCSDTQPPTNVAVSANPTSGTAGTTSISLNGTANDNVGVTKMQWFNGAAQIGADDITSPFGITYTFPSPGNFNITSKAFDACGNSTSSSPITVNIIGGGGGATGNAWSSTDLAATTYRNGRVGIGGNTVFNFGSTESEYNLLVKGGIKSEKFKVELPSSGGWADYIFQKEYKLLPLRQLDSYIKLHHHLPNFPSEKDIKAAGGYEMSDIIKRQQESIEELHLYIIDLEKRINQLENKNQK